MPTKPKSARRPVRSTRLTRKSSTDAIALLKRDHVTVKQLLNRLEATSERAVDQRRSLLKELEDEIKTHTKIEEEIFYPAFREAARRADEHIYFEAVEEHHVVDMVLPELKSTGLESDKFEARAKVVKDLIEHHAGEEETEMFPKARKVMTAAELRELGKLLQTRKRELKAGLLARVAMKAGSTVGHVANVFNGRNKKAA